MSPLERRMRPYDILPVIGIVVLLTATPAYYAQVPSVRPLADGSTFVTPGPRAGGHAEYELILRVAGHGVVSTGTVLRVDHREPTEAERAMGATAAVDTHRPARHIRFGPATFIQDEALDHALFGHDVKRLRSLKMEWVHHDPLVMDPPYVATAARSTTHDAGGNGIFVPKMWQRTEYEPQRDIADLIPRVFLDAPSDAQEAPTQEPMQAGVQPPNGDDRHTAPFAAVHRGTALYAKDVQIFGFDRQELDLNEAAFGDPYRTLENETGPAYIGFTSFLGRFHLLWEGPFGGITDRRLGWTWHAAELPTYAGHHVELQREDGTAWLELDLVVRDHHAGEGPVLLDLTGRDASGTHEAPRGPWPGSTLGELQEDTRPFTTGITLAALHRWLEESAAPDEVMKWMDEGALIDGFVWEHLDDGTSHWLIHLALPDGRATGLSARLVGDRMRDVELSCGRQHLIEARLPFDVQCQAAPSAPPPQDLFPHPSDLLGHLRSREGWSETTEVIGIYAPSGGIRTHLPGMANSWDSQASLIGTTVNGEVVATIGPSYGAAYRTITPSDEEGHMGATLRVQEPEPATAPRIVDPFGPEAAYGGLALVLLGILLRVVAALKAGAHLPVLASLYAKITRDKVLLHEHRETIHALVQGDPGLTIREVVERSGLSRTGAFHHLETLAKNGLVAVTTIGRTRHFFPAEMKGPRERMRVAVRRNPDWDAVLSAVEAHPGAALHELLPHVPQGKSSLSRVGKRLERLGLVRKEPEGRTVRFFPTSSSADPAPSGRASS